MTVSHLMNGLPHDGCADPAKAERDHRFSSPRPLDCLEEKPQANHDGEDKHVSEENHVPACCMQTLILPQKQASRKTLETPRNRGFMTDRQPATGLLETYFDQMVDEFYQRFEQKLTIDPQSGCWNWIGFQDGKGYGRVSLLGRPRPAYRVAYEMYCERIPEGMHLDHLCRNPKCCNPDHLEPVTPAENTRRGKAAEVARDRWLHKSHCKNGHPFSGENLIITEKQRICRTCRTLRKRAYREKLGVKKGRNIDGLALGAHASIVARKSQTHCKRGHEWTPENTGIQKSGRYCKKCGRARGKSGNRLAYLMATLAKGEAA